MEADKELDTSCVGASSSRTARHKRPLSCLLKETTHCQKSLGFKRRLSLAGHFVSEMFLGPWMRRKKARRIEHPVPSAELLFHRFSLR